MFSAVKTLSALSRYFFPGRCALCDDALASDGALCASCWNRLEYVAPPFCKICRLPGDTETGVCRECERKKPAFAAAYAAYIYNDAASSLISRLKFKDGLHVFPFLADACYFAAKDGLAECDVLVPVPMHPRRLRARMYNQSALLARRIAKKAGKPVFYRALRRVKHTAPQTGKSRKQRLRNLSGAFRADIRKHPQISGAVIGLIDDVYTTGATLSACARALKQAGAAKVIAITVCRTPERRG